MNKPHKHADVIKAFADGKQIQFRYYNNQEWLDWDSDTCPTFLEYYQYRVKPEPLSFYGALSLDSNFVQWDSSQTWLANIKATFDTETGEIISVEVIK